ncbi:MAG: C4-dicarboxylate ABC transporter, partial [Clostridia bacterium]|nr:C4-dicarboxylate ABC transporter [Clostridia bacterium]
MESSKQVNFRSIATLALAVLYLINEIIKVEWLGLVTGFLLVGVLSLSLLAVEGASRAIGIGLFVVGGIIFTWLGAEPALWFQGLNRNLYLLAMFILVPLLGAPIRQGGYMETLRSFFRQYIRVDSLFYLLVKSFTLFIAVMINVAVIPLMHQIGLASDKSSNSRLMAVSLSRGFAASIIWAPSYAAVALVLELSGARWIDLFPYGLGLGVGAILLGSLMTRIEGQQGKTEPEINQQEAIQQSLGEQSEGVNWEKIAELGFFGLVLIGGIVVASQLTGIATVTVVSMAAIIFPVVWLAAIGCLPRWWTEVRG